MYKILLLILSFSVLSQPTDKKISGDEDIIIVGKSNNVRKIYKSNKGKLFWFNGKQYPFSSWKKKCIVVRRTGNLMLSKMVVAERTGKIKKIKMRPECVGSYDVSVKKGEIVLSGDGGKHRKKPIQTDGDIDIDPSDNKFVFQNGRKCHYLKSWRECLQADDDKITSRDGDILYMLDKSKSSLNHCQKSSDNQSIVCPDGTYIKSYADDDSLRHLKFKLDKKGRVKQIKKIKIEKK